MVKILLILLVAQQLTATWGYGSGAGDLACTNGMVPQHDADAQTTQSPYRISFSAAKYAAGDTISLTLAGPDKFKGFLLLARNDSSNVGVGSFTAEGPTVKTRCDGSGLTHGNPLNTKSLEVTWQAPAQNAGNVQFFATFVQEQDTFWVSVPSELLWDGTSTDKEPIAPPLPAVTEAPTSSGDKMDAVSQNGCDSAKGCWLSCQGDACKFLVTYTKDVDKDMFNFELFASNVQPGQYAALGLAPKGSMADVSIIACTTDGVKQYYAKGKNPPTSPDAQPVNTESAQTYYDAEKKTMTCRFPYDNGIAKSALGEWKDLDTPQYSFLAIGGYSDNTISKHLVTPPISATALDFSSVATTGTGVNRLIKAHGALMVLAWVFCASLGIILAKYYKPMWTDTKACGQKVWFQLHRSLMLAAMFISLLGFVMILIHQEGNFRLPAALPKRAHPILGLIAIICSFLNPLIAAFRCHPGDRMRPVFNWVHWFFGTVAHVFAIVAIFLGMLFTDQADIPTWLGYVMMAFCLVHVCVEFTLEIHNCCMYDKNRDRQEQFEMTKQGGMSSEPAFAGRGFRCAMLVVYGILVTILALVMLFIIAFWKNE